MQTGAVKWFNSEKGYGFIIRDGDAHELFFHRSKVLGIGRDDDLVIEPSRKVTFDPIKKEKGLNAINVRLLSQAHAQPHWRE